MEDAVKILSDKKDKKIKNICWEYLKAKQQEQEIKQKIAQIQFTVKEYFKSNSGLKSLQFTVGETNYKFTDVNPTKIVWDIEKLLKRFKKNKIDKEIINQVILKEYTVTDWRGFTKVLSGKGISPDEILLFISVDKKVDQKKLNQLSEIGEITDKDIEGCYTVENIVGSLKTTEWEKSHEQT